MLNDSPFNASKNKSFFELTFPNKETYYTKAGKVLLNMSLGNIYTYFPASIQHLDFSIAVAGGCFRSYFNKELPKDLDLFLLTPFDTAKQIMSGVSDFLHNNTIAMNDVATITSEYVSDSTDWDKKTVSKKILRLNIPCSKNNPEIPIQLLYFGYFIDGIEIYPKSARDLITRFDIVPACFAAEARYALASGWTFSGTASHQRLLESLATKILIPNESTNSVIVPSMSINRFYKYVHDYGFSVESKEDMKILSSYMLNGKDINFDYNDEDL